MTDAGHPPPARWGQPPTIVAGRFVLDESPHQASPRRTQRLRDWWWSGTREQRWTAAIGAPLAVLVLAGAFTALADDNPDQQTAATGTTTEAPSPESTSANPTPTPSSTPTVTVTTILTGDTIVVSRDSGTETVRLIGIDAPELSGNTTGQQCWATESTQFASDTLLQQEVRLTPDPTQGDVDDSGATLAYVLMPDGRDFSIVSAGAGFARSYTDSTPAAKITDIAAAEKAARTASLGLWGEPCNGGMSMPEPTVEPTPTTTAAPTPTTTAAPPPVPPPPPVVTDPRFATCLQARVNGYGPYVQGVDPEYYWYVDKDGDGIACERVGVG